MSRNCTTDDRYSSQKRRGAQQRPHQHVRPNRDARVRRREWKLTVDDSGPPSAERIMERGELERRATVSAQAEATLEDVNRSDVEVAWKEAEAYGEVGVVLEVSSSLCRVSMNGHVPLCGLRGSLSMEDTGYTNLIAVGDRVIVSSSDGEHGIIEKRLPRHSTLSRPDPFHRHLKQVIVANADQLLIVASWREPPVWFELVDRYLISAERNQLTAILCVSKVDLAEDIDSVPAAVRPYIELGYPVLTTSVVTGVGIELLRQSLDGHTTVLAGLSGVGKSSLLTAIYPDLDLRIGGVSTHWGGQGQHTTTQVNMFALDGEGFVVDTPGIREFAVTGLLPAELLRFYPEIAAIAHQCRFTDCSHTHEPGCAVKAALQEGQLSSTRYHNYRCILEELSR